MKTRIVIHATKTPSDMKVTADDIEDMNSQDRYSDPMPYHYIVNIDGSILKGTSQTSIKKARRALQRQKGKTTAKGEDNGRGVDEKSRGSKSDDSAGKTKNRSGIFPDLPALHNELTLIT